MCATLDGRQMSQRRWCQAQPMLGPLLPGGLPRLGFDVTSRLRLDGGDGVQRSKIESSR